MAVDRNIPICAPIHDAIAVEAASTEIAAVVNEISRCMVEASRAVLGGPAIRVDVNPPLYFPDRYVDGRDGSTELWATATRLLQQPQEQAGMSKRNPFANLEALRQGADVVDFPPAKRARSQRLVAFPWAFLVDVCHLTHSRTALAVAVYIYRRTTLQQSNRYPAGRGTGGAWHRPQHEAASLGTTESGRTNSHWRGGFGRRPR